MTVKIRPETLDDWNSIRDINLAAFGSSAEADLVDTLREGGYVSVSLVAEDENKIVGHILFSKTQIITDQGTQEALSLAPMAVLPRHQRQGIRSKLIVAGINECQNQGCEVVVVLGHPDYYPRFGFSAELAKSLESPFGGGEAWMALELVRGALNGCVGRIVYAPPFSQLG